MYTRKEIAEIFKVSPLTVFRWIQNGEIRAIKVGKSYRISEDEVEFIKKNGLRQGKKE